MARLLSCGPWSVSAAKCTRSQGADAFMASLRAQRKPTANAARFGEREPAATKSTTMSNSTATASSFGWAVRGWLEERQSGDWRSQARPLVRGAVDIVASWGAEKT